MTANETACSALTDLFGNVYFSSGLAQGILSGPLILVVGTNLAVPPPGNPAEFPEYVEQVLESMDNINSRVCHGKIAARSHRG